MAIVDLAQLTADQRYGITFEMQLANDVIARKLDAGIETRAAYTLQEYADKLMGDRANAGYAGLLAYKQRIAVEAFQAADAETQSQVLAILNVPDVIQ